MNENQQIAQIYKIVLCELLHLLWATLCSVFLMETKMFSLQTNRLLLRDFQPDDFELFYATTNDPEYQQFYAKEETTRPFWQKIFSRILEGTTAVERTQYQLAICLPDSRLIGTCGVRLEDVTHQQASFGCAIGRPYWGHGYATEAAQELFDFGFSQLPVHRIYAETNAENHRARALAAHLGMRLEGILQHNKYFRDRWWDTAVYAILRGEWEANN